MANKGLGRGLSALLGEDAVAAEQTAARILRISEIEPNPHQPRRRFDEQAMAELAESIRLHGLLQPIAVRKNEEEKGAPYRIIAGERRWRAARQAGLSEVPAVVLEADDRRASELALVENLQREDLNPIEEAQGLAALMEDYGLTQDETARRVGRSRPAVANALRLLSLPEPVLKLVREGTLSAGHARALLAVGDAGKQLEAAQLAVQEGLSVRQLERLAAKPARPGKRAEEDGDGAFAFDSLDELQRRLSSRLGRRVLLKKGRKKGRIEIEYYGNDDLETLVRLLESAQGQ